MKRINNKKGFTLIELVIVVTVLAVLAIIAVPTVWNIVAEAKNSSDESNLALYQSAIERSNIANDIYPADATAARTAIKSYTSIKKIKAPKSSAGHYYYATGAYTDSGTGITYRLGQVFISTTAPGQSDKAEQLDE